jgi:hypothetical protein
MQWVPSLNLVQVQRRHQGCEPNGASPRTPTYHSTSCGWRASAALPRLILDPERRLGLIERRRVAVALAAGQLERHALEPRPVRLLKDTPHVALAVEHVEVGFQPRTGRARDRSAAQDSIGMAGHRRPVGYRRRAQLHVSIGETVSKADAPIL